LDTDAVAESPGKILQEISKLSYIQTVSVDGSFEESPHFPFGKLRVLNRLRTLEVTFSRPLDQPDVDELSQLVGLKVLALWDISVELPAILARLRTKLPGCRIVTMYEDEISRTFP
jgi:hypothetical protein